MNKKTAMLLFAAILAMPIAARAQIEATPVPESPKPDFSSFNYLLGTWTCSTKSARRPAAYTSTTTYRMDPSGYWIESTTVVNPMAWFNHKRTLHGMLTYDDQAHRWITLGYGEMGGYQFAVSNGWSGNQIAWHDLSFTPSADIKAQSDNTITRESNTKTVANSNFTEANGRVVDVVERCTKS